MDTTETTQTGYLTDWEGLTVEQVRKNAQEIDTVRAQCLGSLSAAMFYSFNALLAVKSYAEYGLEAERIAKRATEDFERLAKIVEDTNEMYRRIDGKDLLEIPKW